MLLSSHILAEVQQVCHSVVDHRQRPAARLRRGRGPARREPVQHPRRRRATRPGGRDASSGPATGSSATATTCWSRAHDHPEDITRLLAGERHLRPRALRRSAPTWSRCSSSSLATVRRRMPGEPPLRRRRQSDLGCPRSWASSCPASAAAGRSCCWWPRRSC